MKQSSPRIRFAFVAGVLSLVVFTSGCSSRKEASAPSYREQQAAAQAAQIVAPGGAPASNAGAAVEERAAAPVLPGDPGYKPP
ncbi:MAG: hypothetical protein H8F28_11705 [Fibrella sp.]|nr:hypothetical protein [Armatimonadota bacterium]